MIRIALRAGLAAFLALAPAAAPAQVLAGGAAPTTGSTTLRVVDSRSRFPTISVLGAVATNNLATISEQGFFMPYAAKDLRCFFPNFFVNINGVSAPETNTGNPIAVYFAMEVNAGPWVTGTISGVSPTTIGDGLGSWSEAGVTTGIVPAGAIVRTRTLAVMGDTQSRPGGLRSIVTGGGIVEGLGRKSALASDLIPALSGTALTSVGAAVTGVDQDLYGPSACIGSVYGAPPRAVAIHGDSIDYDRSGTLTASDANQNQGMWTPAFWALGWGTTTVAIQGLKMQYEGATDATAGLVKRSLAFTQLPQLPFTDVLTGLAHNDTSGSTFSTMKTNADKSVLRYRALYPGTRLYWASPTPFTTGTFTTLAGQTQNAAAISPAGAMWAFRDYVIGNMSSTIDGHISRAAAGALFWKPGDPEDKWFTFGDTAANTTDGTHPIDVMHAIMAIQNRTQVQQGAMN